VRASLRVRLLNDRFAARIKAGLRVRTRRALRESASYSSPPFGLRDPIIVLVLFSTSAVKSGAALMPDLGPPVGGSNFQQSTVGQD
jgi:hypothetical protein